MSGLISFILFPITSALAKPSVLLRAGSCLFLFVEWILSPSTIVIDPTPALHIISAAYAPTPPKPTTSTLEFLSFCQFLLIQN